MATSDRLLAHERDEAAEPGVVIARGDGYSLPTISFEEAIQREMEYQRRKKHSREVGPNPSQTGEKRKEIPEAGSTQAKRQFAMNHQRQQKNAHAQQHAAQTPLFWCNICQVHCASSASLRSHRYSKMHRAKFEETHNRNNNSNADMLWCEECNVPCMNQVSLAQHRSGKKHMARIEFLRSRVGAPGAR